MSNSNLSIIVTIGDNDGSFALPYSEENLQRVLDAAPVDRTASWRGIADFTYNDKRLTIQILQTSDIKQPRAVAAED